jgi:predicted PurR-regulated permease PerM
MPEPVTRRIDVSTGTFVRLLAFAALVWAWLRLWQWVLIFVVAVFLAVSLDPLVKWLDRRGLKRPFGSVLVVAALTLALIGFLSLSGAELTEQAGLLQRRIGETWQQVRDRLPDEVLRLLPQGAGGQAPSGGDASAQAQGGGATGGTSWAYRAGRAMFSALTSILVALVLTVYLLVDGRRTYEWLVAFAPPKKRPRVHETADEARLAIIGYMRGNVATSVLAAIVTFVVLSVLKVPAALLLGIVAGILNFVPVIGIVLSLVPAVLLALTVSPAVAATVAGFYLVYNAVENYYIQPKVYGHEMQLSGLAVLAAFAVGAELGGIIGALIALPFAAMYPPIERLWLKESLPAAVEDHRRIEQTDEH